MSLEIIELAVAVKCFNVSCTAFDSDVRVSKIKAFCQISASLPLSGICEQHSCPAACVCWEET